MVGCEVSGVDGTAVRGCHRGVGHAEAFGDLAAGVAFGAQELVVGDEVDPAADFAAGRVLGVASLAVGDGVAAVAEAAAARAALARPPAEEAS